MKLITSILLALMLFSPATFASSTRIITADQINSSDLSKLFSFPAATDTLVGRASTDTLTNKLISGSTNTLTSIPAANITGVLAAGVTGGAGLSIATSQLTGTLAAGQFPALTGDVSTTAGSFATTLATVNSNVGTFSNAMITVNAKGLITAASSGTGSTPNIVGSTGSPSLITAVGGISFSGSNYFNTNFIAGSGSAVTVTASPQIAAGSSIGQTLVLIGESATNTVTIADGNGLSMNGPWVAGLQSVIEFEWDGTVWTEKARR